MTPKVQTHAQHRNSESGYRSVQQSSRYVTYGLHVYECAAHWHTSCALQEGNDVEDGMDRWSTFNVFFDMC